MAGEKREREDEQEKKPTKKLDGDFLVNWTKSMISLLEKIQQDEEKRARIADNEETQDDGHNLGSPPPSPPRPF